MQTALQNLLQLIKINEILTLNVFIFELLVKCTISTYLLKINFNKFFSHQKVELDCRHQASNKMMFSPYNY
jgi:hypothetical protein